MIRRDCVGPDQRPCWQLISQVDHAHLAERLAAAWQSTRLRFEPRVALLSAIRHHDDGWAEWETLPGVNPGDGRPLAFTEMPLAESLVIWTRSIDAAAKRGPLEAHVTSAHFCALLERTNRWQERDDPPAGEARVFLRQQRGLRATWLDELANQSDQPTADMQTTDGLAWLQFFDNLSLWFCCAPRHESYTLEAPSGTLTFSPAGPQIITVSPWPLATPELSASVPAREVPAVGYSTPEILAAAKGRKIALSWRLSPPGAGQLDP